MGLLLIFMMSTPIFSILGKGSELTESFLDNFSEENREKELREFQNIKKVYLEKGYELELEQKIRETLEKRGIEVYKVKVNIEGEETQANLVLKTEISQEERKELKDDKNNNNAKDNADNNATDNENMTDDAGIDNGDTVSEGPEGAGNAGNGTVDGTTAEEGTVARDLGDGVRAVGDGVGDAVEDVGDAVGDVVDGRE